jgi:Concanavalin A-like lectin/glucanases superfamily
MPGIDSFTKLCLHCDGADGSTSFPDASFGTHTITAHGNAQVDTAQSVFGGASALFDGSGDWLSADGSSDFALGTGDFAIDFRFRRNGSGVYILADFTNDHEASGPLLIFTNGSDIVFYSNGARITASSVTADLTWYHFALVRSSGTTRMFLDGAQVGSDFTDSRDYGVSANCPTFGANALADGAFPLNGWMDEIRISKGTSRGWAGGFTPPAAAYSAAVPRVQAAIMG